MAAIVDESMGQSWASEPAKLSDLDSMYETVTSCPGRLPTTLIKIVKAIPKGADAATHVEDGQEFKLFIVRGLLVLVSEAAKNLVCLRFGTFALKASNCPGGPGEQCDALPHRFPAGA